MINVFITKSIPKRKTNNGALNVIVIMLSPNEKKTKKTDLTSKPKKKMTLQVSTIKTEMFLTATISRLK